MPPPPVKYYGLLNQGATCYLNSVLQVLFMTKDFRAAVESHKSENHDTDCIDPHLKALFDDLKREAAVTCDITKKLGIDRVYEQRDAAEYFEKILNLTSPEASKIFHGKLTNKIVCSACGTETDSDGAFWHLPLALVNSYSEHYSVLDGIEEYFRTSHFSGENQMYCDRCDGKSDATTKCVIKDHPKVLVLLLKRFEFDYRYMTYVKINRIVDVPCTLRIPENQKYELYAVVEHFGDLRSGHYTTTIKDDERWYNFDDNKVMLLDNQPFHVDNFEKSCSAYLLFYRRNERAADTCTQDNREVSTPGGFPPATSDQAFVPRQDKLQREVVEEIVEVEKETVVTVSMDTNETTGTKDRVGSRGVGFSPDLCFNQDQDKEVYAGQIIPNSHQDRNDLSYLQDAHAETHRDEVEIEDKEDMGGNAEAEKRETLSRETHLEERIGVQDSDSGRQKTPDISHDFKLVVSDRHTIHLNKQDEMSNAERRVMDVKTDEDRKEKKREILTKNPCRDAERQDTEGLENVRQSVGEDLGDTQEVGGDYDLKSVSVDKWGNEEIKERDVKADEEVKTRDRGMASGSRKLLTKYDLSRFVSVDKWGNEERKDRDVKTNGEVKTGGRGMASGSGKLFTYYDLCYNLIEVGDSQQKMPKDDQGESRRYKRHKQPREEKVDVQGDEEQERGDDKHAERRETSGRQQDFGQGRLDDVRQSRSGQKIIVTHARPKDVVVERQTKQQEKKEGESSANPSLGQSEKTRQGDSEFNGGRVRGRRGSEKSTPSYVIVDDEIKGGIQRTTETKYIILQRTSHDGNKSCVENSVGNVKRINNPKANTKVSLSERVHNLKLSVASLKHRIKRAIGNVHQESETNSTIHSLQFIHLPNKSKKSLRDKSRLLHGNMKWKKELRRKKKLPLLSALQKQQREEKRNGTKLFCVYLLLVQAGAM